MNIICLLWNIAVRCDSWRRIRWSFRSGFRFKGFLFFFWNLVLICSTIPHWRPSKIQINGRCKQKTSIVSYTLYTIILRYYICFSMVYVPVSSPAFCNLWTRKLFEVCPNKWKCHIVQWLPIFFWRQALCSCLEIPNWAIQRSFLLSVKYFKNNNSVTHQSWFTLFFVWERTDERT